MARTDNLTNFLTDIADAIREKTGSSDPIQASSFDTAIENIPSGGGDIDWSEIGYSSTPQEITSGFNYAKNIYDNWDSSITTAHQMFKEDTELRFFPLVDTSNITEMRSMFYKCYYLTSIPQLNTSNATTINSMFWGCSAIKSIPQFDTSNAVDMQAVFYGCSHLVSVPQLDASSAISISNMFQNCYDLQTFGGLKDIGKAYLTTRAENYSSYTFSLSACSLLTHESLMNVINNLYDIKTKGCNNQKLQLGSTNLAKLTEEEIAIATNKGWNVT